MNEQQITRRQHLVKSALEKIVEGSLESGTLVPVPKLEECFGLSYGTQAFGWLVSELRRALCHEGIYLSGEGVEENKAYIILHGRDHAWVAKLAMARAERSLDMMEVLLRRTDTAKFSKLEKARHTATLQEVAMKAKVLRRSAEAEKVIRPIPKASLLPELSESQPGAAPEGQASY